MSKMKSYRVTWDIAVDAKSIREAAKIAREIQLDPDRLATHFLVDGKVVELGRKIGGKT